MATWAEFDELDALDLADLVRTGQVDPETLLEALPDGAPRYDGGVDAVWSLWEDRARGAIRRGLPDGPFRGVPFFLKDLGLQIEGEITTNGSRFLADAVPLQWTASNIPIGLHFSAPSAAMRG